jgi:hypothetical protein
MNTYIVLAEFTDDHQLKHVEGLLYTAESLEDLTGQIESDKHVRFTEEGILYRYGNKHFLTTEVRAFIVGNEVYRIISKHQKHAAGKLEDEE